jgi:maltooligosyltrehalose trehalohydrolase
LTASPAESAFAHEMPFGAELLAWGATRFRIWAPSSPSVDLLLDAHTGAAATPLVGAASALLVGADRHRLERRTDGWHELTLAGVGAGARYAFEVNSADLGSLTVPDPASRSNPQGVHAASAVVDPRAYRWRSGEWRGRPWAGAVIYEVHVGTFTAAGTFAALEAKLPELEALGITALQLMPLAAFPGVRNWGYDGVLLFAPTPCYGSGDELKSLIDAAHACGLMVLLDVVYNHFGPDGNYLHAYCPEFFNRSEHTPWGAAINLDGPESRTVRDFFVHNALYWIEEYRFDGLRLDAVHAFRDRSHPDLVEEIAAALREGPGRSREVHLVLENHRNEARYLARDSSGRPRVATAQWNDDLHHALHALLTGERAGYYVDFADDPLARLGRALAEGFAFQGEHSIYRARTRGEKSATLPPAALVSFLQNHDMIGNRAGGERIDRLAPAKLIEAAYALLLLAPQVPMLFMGEEFAASTPFLYFCDLGRDLGRAIAAGRRREQARFASFGAASSDPSSDPQPPQATAARGVASVSAQMPETNLLQPNPPEPNDERTFFASKLAWDEQLSEPHRSRRALIAQLLALRRRHAEHLAQITQGGRFTVEEGLMRVEWRAPAAGAWRLWVNFARAPRRLEAPPPGESIYRSGHDPCAPLELASGGVWVTRGN